MPKAKVSRICSFSSEDQNHPAKNLLNPETYRKWKCKEPGEKEAFVILQLEEAKEITSIDIGNECSAFIEILVGRSGGDNTEFHTLQNVTTFMTPSESKNLTETNRVKMMCSNFNKTLLSEKWDLVKVVCTQPFNRQTQYGISFININVPADPNEKPKIGPFGLLAPKNEDEDEPVRIGSLFAKRMEALTKKAPLPASPPSTSAIIRGISTSLASSQLMEERVEEILRPIKEKHKISTILPPIIPSSPISNNPTPALTTTPSSSSNRPSVSTPPPLNKTPKLSSTPQLNNSYKKTKSPSTTPTSIRANSNSIPKSPHTLNAPKTKTMQHKSNTSSPSSSSANNVKNQQNSGMRRKVVKKKPFVELFRDVIFVISGFENPYRGELRKKATQMGALCKHDWDSTCTHLICAFVNTPKFRQVKSSGNGKIVRKEWIEDSYSNKIRYPWRRYCLDPNDGGKRESEDEIIGGSSESDTGSESEFNLELGPNSESNGEKVRASSGDVKNVGHTQRSINDDEESFGAGSSGTRKRKNSESIESSYEDDDIYNADTDVEEEGSGNEASKVNDLKSLTPPDSRLNLGGKTNDFFASFLFFIYPSELNRDQRTEIEKIIQKHKGNISNQLDERVTHIITEGTDWEEDFSDALDKNPNIVVLPQSWILECERENLILGQDPFMILPN